MINDFLRRSKSHFFRAAIIQILILIPAVIFANPEHDLTSNMRIAGLTYGTNIVSSDESGINFELVTPHAVINADGSIDIPGLESSINEPGAPALPFYRTYIALPPEAEVTVDVEESSIFHESSVNVKPAPDYSLTLPDSDLLDDLSMISDSLEEDSVIYEKDSSIYQDHSKYPKDVFEISPPQYIRDLRVVELKLYPARYIPGKSTLVQAQKLTVKINFSGGVLNETNNNANFFDHQSQAWKEMILNYPEASNWRALPNADRGTTAVKLPVSINTNRIEINKDGIYEISAEDLKGFSLPANLANANLVQNGNQVAFQHIDSNNNILFDKGDKIRFFGWALNPSRYEDLYISNNVYWFWIDGNSPPKIVQTVDNGTGSNYTQETSFRDVTTKWPHNTFFNGWAIDWEGSPNDATPWHWDRVNKNSDKPHEVDLDINLPDPVTNSTNNRYTVELIPRLNPLTGILPTYTARTYLNGSANFGETIWTGHKSINVQKTFNGNEFATGIKNIINLKISNNNSLVDADIYVTRVTVEYERQLNAMNDQLIFNHSTGRKEFNVSGFSSSDLKNAIVWDITNPYQPTDIKLSPQNITGSPNNYTYHIRRTLDKNSEFIATTKVQSPVKITQYVPNSLDPPEGAVEWLAITHPSMQAAANKLAAHRRSMGMTAYVALTTDVVNQYGYGFNTPIAIKNYLTHAITNWSDSQNDGPYYLTLFGDATVNPRNLPCSTCTAATWDKDSPTFLVSDFVFKDRWVGMIPTDFTYSLLSGDDLMPDIAVSRIPASSQGEAISVVDKIILYENVRKEGLTGYQEHILFVADNADSGGNFCYENAQTGKVIPASTYAYQHHLCLPEATESATIALRTEMSKYVNDAGVSILNYRGHGSRWAWADTSSSPYILRADKPEWWLNAGKPVIILSADCLDGYYVDPSGLPALGEAFIGLGNVGSSAHWSSSGLGYSAEHSILHAGFYKGLVNNNYVRIGDAVNYSKIFYTGRGHESELYSFILLGDAAMNLLPFKPSGIYFPSVFAP